MRFIELKPRKNRSKMARERRNARFKRGVFSRYHFFKVVLKHGRRRLLKWWRR